MARDRCLKEITAEGESSMDNLPGLLSRLDAKRTQLTHEIESAHAEFHDAQHEISRLEAQIGQIDYEIQNVIDRSSLRPPVAPEMHKVEVIRILVNSNPHRPGTKDHGKFSKIETGMTVEQARESGVDRGYLRYAEKKLKILKIEIEYDPPGIEGEFPMTDSDLGYLQEQQRDARERLEGARLRFDVAHRHPQAVKRSLEQALIDFLVELKVLIKSVNDRAVLYLLSNNARMECVERNIGVEAFESWEVKEKVAETLNGLRFDRDSIGDEDRQEADLFHEAWTFLRRRERFLNEASEADENETNLEESKNAFKREIAEIERKVAEFGLLRSIFDDGGLRAKRSALKSIEAKLESLRCRRIQHIREAANYVSHFKKQASDRGMEFPVQPNNPNDPFENIVGPVLGRFHRWRTAHPEIEKLVGRFMAGPSPAASVVDFFKPPYRITYV